VSDIIQTADIRSQLRCKSPESSSVKKSAVLLILEVFKWGKKVTFGAALHYSAAISI